MGISRRKFLTSVGGAVAAGLAWRGLECGEVPVMSRDTLDCLLVDLGYGCGLRESLAGYRSALAELGVQFKIVSPTWIPAARVFVVPAAVQFTNSLASILREHLKNGSRLLLESAAGFVERRDFCAQQAVLRRYFEIEIAGQRNLWGAESPHRGVPYVDYVWPHAAQVRDHSRVVTLKEDREGIIGRVQDIPVALKRMVGKGTLIFLGSPLGPGLWAGDPEAREWLRSALHKA